MNGNKYRTYVGNGAAQVIELGFVPTAAIIQNLTDGTNFTLWFAGLPAGAGIAVVAAAGPVLDAANQVTAFQGSATQAPGLTIGTDLSVNAKTYGLLAFRTADPVTQPAGAANTGASA